MWRMLALRISTVTVYIAIIIAILTNFIPVSLMFYLIATIW